MWDMMQHDRATEIIAMTTDISQTIYHHPQTSWREKLHFSNRALFK